MRNSGGGKPASLKIASIASAAPVTFDACLSRPALPAMSAGAANRNTCQSGKFHGITASTGPRGSNATKLREASVFASRSASSSCAWSA